MIADLVLKRCRLRTGAEPVDVAIRGDRICAVGRDLGGAATHDADGRVALPGLVEAHIHLDKALLLDRAPSREGTLAEAIRVTGEAKRGFTAEDIRTRARRVLDAALTGGTTAMRSHVEVDPIIGLRGLEALLPLRDEYAPALTLQLCAFAQEGIVQAPGTAELLREALRLGADAVGGCPYNDTDARAHIDTVFALAREFDVDADFHVDFDDEPRHLHVEMIAAQTIQRGWQGRVAVGHLTELAALDVAAQARIAVLLREAGIGVIVLPATDLYLMGRRDDRNVRRGLAPVRRLLDAGVPVAAASNNVGNAFTPVGTGRLPLMGFLTVVAAHMGGAADLARVVDMLTLHPARMLRLPDYGLAPGCRADVTVWDCERPEDVVAALAPCRLVVKHGAIVAVTETRTTEPWRPETRR